MEGLALKPAMGTHWRPRQSGRKAGRLLILMRRFNSFAKWSHQAKSLLASSCAIRPKFCPSKCEKREWIVQ